MVISLAISVIGYILLITVNLDNIGLTYFAIFMTTVGVSLLLSDFISHTITISSSYTVPHETMIPESRS